jgi:hypothetical protein
MSFGDIEVSREGHSQRVQRDEPRPPTYAEQFRRRHPPTHPPTAGQVAVWVFTVERLRRCGQEDDADALEAALAPFRPKSAPSALAAELANARRTYTVAIAKGEVTQALELKARITELEARVAVEADVAAAHAAVEAEQARKAARERDARNAAEIERQPADQHHAAAHAARARTRE